ncbi:MAG: gliding motility-associated C-terminal domain-containing protein [Flavobacteriales bacterium]
MLQRTTSALAALLVALTMNATHIVGGEIYYDHLGGDQYQVTLKLYRDCTGIPFDANALVGVFAGDGTYLFEQSLTFPGGSFVPIVLDSPCLTLPPNVCIETTSYTGVFTLPPTPDGYHLTYQRCCRTSAIVNLPNPGDLGLTCTVRVPGQDVVSTNSSPRFTELPPVALCLDQPLVFDHSATDPDGDVLEYSLCTPLNGGDMLTPTPDPPAAPPYVQLPWLAPTYSENYPMDSDPAISIDANTGQLTVTPTLLGSFVVGVMVREYRDGVLLTESRRDFMFKVVACDATVTAGISPQLEFCTGLTMNFGNSSSGGQTWSWDFGVPDTDADTSNVIIPTWTYTEQGVYNVTLVANPGTICADTITAVLQVFIAPEPTFVPPPAMCGSTPVTLIAEGTFGPQASLEWQLGTGTIPSSATGGQVMAEFEATGVHPVTLTATENGCIGTYTADVTVYPQPEAYFSAFPLAPQLVGVPVAFTDGSATHGGSIATWAWMINGIPVGTSAPVLDWTSTWPGTYVVSLTITTIDGCTDTYTMTYVVDGGPIIIPNVFSPNGDDENEAFHIVNVDHYNNELKIYSRWGNMVYQTTNYKNDWKGSGLSEGTYYYVLHITDDREYAGHVTLLR